MGSGGCAGGPPRRPGADGPRRPAGRVRGVSLALYRTYRPGDLRRRHRAGARHRPLRRALRNGRVAPRLPVQRAARLRQDLHGADPGPRRSTASRAPRRSRAACASCAGPRAERARQPRRRRDRRRHARRGRRRPRAARAGHVRPGVASRYKVYIIDEAHQVPARRQRAAQARSRSRRRTCGSSSPPPSRTRSSPPSAVAHAPLPVPARAAAASCRSTWRGCAGRRASPRARGARDGRPRRRGSVRDALSVLGQLIAGAGPEGVTYATPSGCSASPTPRCSTRSSTRSRPRDGAADVRARRPGRRERHRPAPLRRRPARAAARPDRAARRCRTPPSTACSTLPTRTLDDHASRRAARSGRAELSRAADLVSAGLSEMQGHDGAAAAARAALRPRCCCPASTTPSAGVLARLDRVERRSRSPLRRSALGRGDPACRCRNRRRQHLRRPTPRATRLRSRRPAPRGAATAPRTRAAPTAPRPPAPPRLPCARPRPSPRPRQPGASTPGRTSARHRAGTPPAPGRGPGLHAALDLGRDPDLWPAVLEAPGP